MAFPDCYHVRNCAALPALLLHHLLVFHSAFISRLKGTGVRITAEQFPDLHQRVVKCCEKLRIIPVPDAYLIHMGGIFNALATRFLGRNFIVLYSDVVDALEPHPDAVNFYIGHELGHIHRKHLLWWWVLWPAGVLPLLGAAYSRAREYTCDLYGLACCDDQKSAVHGLTALAAGHRRWQSIDVRHYVGQVQQTGGFWMLFHELISDYPWLVKRVARINAKDNPAEMPGRNVMAWLLALFIPRLGVGGSAASVLIVVAIVGILAAVALPAYQDYTVRAKLSEAVIYGNQAAKAVEEHVYKTGAIPVRLEDVGVSSTPPSNNIKSVGIDSQNGTIQVVLAFSPLEGKSVLFIPSTDQNKRINWRCASNDIPSKYLPLACR